MVARGACVKKTFRIAPNVETPKGQGGAKKARFGRDGIDNTNHFSLPGPPIEAKLVQGVLSVPCSLSKLVGLTGCTLNRRREACRVVVGCFFRVVFLFSVALEKRLMC